jgi:hypothetical protein
MLQLVYHPHTTEASMTPTDYTTTLEVLLQAAHVPFERRQLQDFVADCWPATLDDPNRIRWATAFQEALAPRVAEEVMIEG